MAYVEAHASLREHPKTKRLIRMLSISRAQAIGHLLCLWWWCQDYVEDGDLSRYSDDDIADAAEWPGDSQKFVHTLESCGAKDGVGFLVRSDDGGLWVNDWEQYGGKLSIKRRQAKERMQNKRDRDALVTRNVRVTEHDVTRNERDVTAIEETRKDKTRQEETRQDAAAPTASPSLSPSLPTDVAALLNSIGLEPTANRVKQYSGAVAEYGFDVVSAGLTAASDMGKETEWRYVMGCIRNKAQSPNGKASAGAQNGAGAIDITGSVSAEIAKALR